MAAFALFGNRESGHTYKVSLMLALAGMSHDYTEIDLGLARDALIAAAMANSLVEDEVSAPLFAFG